MLFLAQLRPYRPDMMAAKTTEEEPSVVDALPTMEFESMKWAVINLYTYKHPIREHHIFYAYRCINLFGY